MTEDNRSLEEILKELAELESAGYSVDEDGLDTETTEFPTLEEVDSNELSLLDEIDSEYKTHSEESKGEKLVQPKNGSTGADPSIETLESSSPKVTPDGRTLDEVLLGMRKGRRKFDKALSDYKSGLDSTQVNGKTKSSKRYVKYNDRVERDKDHNRDLVRASKKFIQKNSRYSEEEKAIMKNLGVNPKELVSLMGPKSKLNQHDKARLLAMGRNGIERHFKGRRYRATVNDTDFLHFLGKFKLANTKILSRLRGEPQRKAWARLTRLKENGLVVDSEVPGMGTIWYLTEAGMAFSGYDFPALRTRFPKFTTLPPIIGANHVAALLWNNNMNILQLDDFPAYNKIREVQGVPEARRGEVLVSESQIRSSLSTEARASEYIRDGGGNDYQQAANRARAVWHEWETNPDGPRSPLSPEMEIGNEYLWVLYPEGSLTKSFHVPDLVVKRDRASDGSPRSIAVEVELNRKSYKRYYETLLAYKLDNNIYEKVVWVTNSTGIARLLTRIADEIDLEGFDVVPMINENGIYKDRDIWHI